MTVKNFHERNHWTGTAAEMAVCNPGNPAAIWYTTDTQSFFWWDGANWILLGVGGGGGVTEGPGIDLVGNQVGLGGDSFLLYDKETASPVAEFATLTLALAAAVSGQVVICPAGVYTEDVTIPGGVGVVGTGNRTIFSGTFTLNASSTLKSIIIDLTLTDAGAITGIIGPIVGLGYINDCSIKVTNNGDGNAYSVLVGDGDLLLWNSYLQAFANGAGDAIAVYGDTASQGEMNSSDSYAFGTATGDGEGHAYKTDGYQDWYVTAGRAVGTTSPIGV
jgi:hypothetical protein